MPRSRVKFNSYQLSRLRAELKPLRLYWFPSLRSTSDHAVVLRRRGSLFAPAVVLTGHQTAGRGRGANTWWSSGGMLTATFVFPIDERIAPHQVPLLAGLAVRQAASELVPSASIQLKWPNDLLCQGRKLAGLLCERIEKADFIGLGLNVNLAPSTAPVDLRNRITSLIALGNKPLDLSSVLLLVARQLHGMLSYRPDRPFASMLREYDLHHALIGRRVIVSGGSDEMPMTGKVEGLDGMGRLILREGKTLHRVIAGQVNLL